MTARDGFDQERACRLKHLFEIEVFDRALVLA
jgi:hypothetical protein